MRSNSRERSKDKKSNYFTKSP